MKKTMSSDKKAKGVAEKVAKMGKMMAAHEAMEMKSMHKKGAKKGCK